MLPLCFIYLFNGLQNKRENLSFKVVYFCKPTTSQYWWIIISLTLIDMQHCFAFRKPDSTTLWQWWIIGDTIPFIYALHSQLINQILPPIYHDNDGPLKLPSIQCKREKSFENSSPINSMKHMDHWGYHSCNIPFAELNSSSSIKTMMECLGFHPFIAPVSQIKVPAFIMKQYWNVKATRLPSVHYSSRKRH